MQEQIVQLVLSGQWVALSALAIGAVVRIIKSGWWPEWLRVDKRWLPLVAIALGELAGVLEAAATGTPWLTAAVRGLVAAGAAIVGHQVFIEALRGGRELGAPPKATGVALLVLFLPSCDALRAAAPKALPAICDIVTDLVAQQCTEGDEACLEAAAAKVAAALEQPADATPEPSDPLAPSPIMTASTKEQPHGE